MTDQIGRFQVRKRLGGGGFGEVFLAEDPTIGRQVAIKVFRPKDENLIAFATSSNTEGLDILRTRFLNEAKILARLDDEPHVVGVLEFGEMPDGTPYYVMPYLPQSLADELGRDVFDVHALAELPESDRPRALPMDQALDAIEQTLMGLAAAHARGLVHRDIKPSNLMRSEKGLLRIVDFGIAKAPDGQHSTVSHLGMGSRNYMAPEQRESAKHVDARADVYAAGVVAYRALTGKLPIGRFADPNVAVPALGKPMNDLLLRMMAADKAERPKDAGEALKLFRSARQSVGQQDSSEHSGTWVGDQGVSGLRDELKPLRARLIELLEMQGRIGQADRPRLQALAAIGDLDDAGLDALIEQIKRENKAIAARCKLVDVMERQSTATRGQLGASQLQSFEDAAQAVGWDMQALERIADQLRKEHQPTADSADRPESRQAQRATPARPTPQRPAPTTASRPPPPNANSGSSNRWFGIAIAALLLGGGSYGIYQWRQGQLADAEREHQLTLSNQQDDADWQQAKQANTIEAYAAYLKRWPQGRQVTEATRSKTVLEETARQTQLSDAEREQQRIKAIQRDLNALGYTVAENGDADARTVEAIKAFEKASKLVITGSPDAVLAKALSDALTRRDEAAWSKATKADTEAGYNDYRSSHPTGRHASEVDARINTARQRAADQQAESARLAEEQRKADEANKAEEARIAEEQRKAEEARIALVKEIQTQMRRLGRGTTTNGVWDDTTQQIANDFQRLAGLGESNSPSADLLSQLKATSAWPDSSSGPQGNDSFSFDLRNQRYRTSIVVGWEIGSSMKSIASGLDNAAYFAGLDDGLLKNWTRMSTEQQGQWLKEFNAIRSTIPQRPVHWNARANTSQSVAGQGQAVRFGYVAGHQTGASLIQIAGEIDLDAVREAIVRSLAGQSAPLSDKQMNEEKVALTEKIRMSQARETAGIGEKNRREGEAFLRKNATVAAVVTTRSGLQYQVLRQGNGKRPKPISTVKVHYVGWLLDGTKFDSSIDRGEPAKFKVSDVIPGWVEALQLMSVGAKYRVWVPSNLGYGDGGAGATIGPNAVLVFEVELLDVL